MHFKLPKLLDLKLLNVISYLIECKLSPGTKKLIIQHINRTVRSHRTVYCRIRNVFAEHTTALTLASIIASPSIDQAINQTSTKTKDGQYKERAHNGLIFALNFIQYNPEVDNVKHELFDAPCNDTEKRFFELEEATFALIEEEYNRLEGFDLQREIFKLAFEALQGIIIAAKTSR